MERLAEIQRHRGVMRQFGQLRGLERGKHKTLCFSRRGGDHFRSTLRPGDGLDQLATLVLLQQRPAVVECILRKYIFISGRLSPDQRLAQTPLGMDDDPVVTAVSRVTGEGDTGSYCRQQRHDDHRHCRRRAGLIRIQLATIRHRGGRMQRGIYFGNRLPKLVEPAHIQAGTVNPGK